MICFQARTREFDSAGVLLNTSKIEEKFKLGDKIERSKDETMGVITHMQPNKVTLRCDDGNDYELKTDDLLSGDWKVTKDEKPRVEIPEPEKWKVEMQKAFLKSQVQVKLHEGSKNQATNQALKLWSKPKGVTATKAFAKGKLVIPCVTNRIELTMVDEGKPKPSGAFLFAEDKVDGYLAHVFYSMF